MAGSLGELVLRVSAPADRFKRDFAQMSGTVDKFTKETTSRFSALRGGVLGDLGKGFLSGLGMGSAIQGMTMLTHHAADLAKSMALAAFEGRNVGDAIDSWVSHLTGLKGSQESFDHMHDRAQSITAFIKEANQDIARMGGAADAPGGSRLAQYDKLIQSANKEAEGLARRIEHAQSTTLGKFFSAMGIKDKHVGDLKIQQGSAQADAQRLTMERDLFAVGIAAAEKAKQAREELDKLMQKGASLAASVRTPQEQFNASVTDTLKLLEVGAINWQTYERAVREAGSSLEKASEMKQTMDRQTQGVGAVQRGTTAGFSAVQAAARAQADSAKWQQKQLAEAQRQTEIQKQIVAALKRGGQGQPQPVGI